MHAVTQPIADITLHYDCSSIGESADYLCAAPPDVVVVIGVIRALVAAYRAAGGTVRFLHIKAHDASYWNDAADATAKAAAIGAINSCLPLLLGKEWYRAGSALVEWLWCAVASPEYRASFGLPAVSSAIIALPQQQSLTADQLVAVICKPDPPAVDPRATLGVRMATLNVRKKLDDVPKARQKPSSGFLPYLRGQVQDREIQILGVQEAHSSEQGLFARATHVRACSGPHGSAKTGDVEIWFSNDKPWIKDACRAPTVDDLGLIHAEQKILIVKLVLPLIELDVCCFHAPTLFQQSGAVKEAQQEQANFYQHLRPVVDQLCLLHRSRDRCFADALAEKQRP